MYYLLFQELFAKSYLLQYLKLVSAIFHYFLKNNVIVSYFEWSISKYFEKFNLSCFIFPVFHKHFFSPELPCAAHLLKTSCFKKNNCMCNQDNACDVVACPDE